MLFSGGEYYGKHPCRQCQGHGKRADNVAKRLGVKTGDRVTLIRQDNQVIMMNAAVYAMKVLQSSMKGEAEKAGLRSDQDVAEMIMEMRAKENE